MFTRAVRSLAIAAATTPMVVAAPATSLAHEGRSQGDLEMVVGFGTEPAYVGEPNSAQIVLSHGGEPVVDLGDTLDVEVTHGNSEPMRLPLEPFFSVGAFGQPGDYRAWFIPTSAGEYTFHIAGSIEGEDVDESFTSGPGTFSDVQSGSDLQYPVQEPTATELAERIDREVPRLTGAIDEVRTAAAGAAATADDAAGARALGIAGLVVGALGLVVAVGALVVARRRT